MGAVRIFLITLLATIAIYIVSEDLWRTIVLASGVGFLCWGLLGRKVRRPSTFAGCVVTGFGLGMFVHHPVLGAIGGAIIALLAWRPLAERRHRLKERT